MPLWSEIAAELSNDSPPKPKQYDDVRRDYLLRLSNFTGRNTILYASSWLQRHDAPPDKIAIVDQDIHSLKIVASDLRGSDLDIILHSPGGSPAAVEAIVRYLRSRFTDIRVIVPNFAKSAATMIACSANRIVMGKHSFLGPTDPQIPLITPLGPRLVSAQAVLKQYMMITKVIGRNADSAIRSPFISQLEPDLIVTCGNAIELSKSLVGTWLRDYMFKGNPRSEKLATEISGWLSDYSSFISYNRHLSHSVLAEKGLKIESLESDQTVQDLSLSVFHATTHAFTAFRICKIIESCRGRSLVITY